MASIVIRTYPVTDIDYSLDDGRIRSLELYGECLYDEYTGTDTEGWKAKLIDFVREQELDIDKDGLGLHAFVYKLIEGGELKNESY